MNCVERKEYEERIKALEDELDTKERTIAVLRRRLIKERKNRKAKRIDTIFTGFAIMMCGVGAIGFIYAITSFAHWAQFGY